VNVQILLYAKAGGVKTFKLIDPPKGMHLKRPPLHTINEFNDLSRSATKIVWDVPMDMEEKTYNITVEAIDTEGKKGRFTFPIKVPKTKPIQTILVNNELTVTDKNSPLYGMKMKGHSGEDVSNVKLRSVEYGDVWKKRVKKKSPEDVIERIVFVIDNMPEALDVKAPNLFDTNKKWIATGAKIYKYYPNIIGDVWNDNRRVYSGAVKYDGISSYVIPYNTVGDTNIGSKVYMFILRKAQNKGSL